MRGRGVRRVKAVMVAATLMLVVPVAACSRDDPAVRGAKTRTLVVERLVPVGKAAITAFEDGSLRVDELPGDLVPEDALSSIDDIKCLAAVQGLPRGTILRRRHFVEPATLGLKNGLTGGTDQPTGC